MCKQLADVDTDLGNTSDVSYTWSLLVQEKSRLQSLLARNTIEVNQVYMALRKEVA